VQAWAVAPRGGEAADMFDFDDIADEDDAAEAESAEAKPAEEKAEEETTAEDAEPGRSVAGVKQLLAKGRASEAEVLADALLKEGAFSAAYQLRKLQVQALLHPTYQAPTRGAVRPVAKKPLTLARNLEKEQPADTALPGLVGRAMCLEGQRKEAEELWKKAAAKDGPDSEAKRLLRSLVIMEDEKARGNVAFKDGKWEAACQAYTRALDADPHRIDRDMSAAILGNRSAAHRKLLQFEAALADADESAVLLPSYAKARFRRGLALLEMERYKDALEDLRAYKALDPKAAGLDDWIERAQHWSVDSAHRNHYGALGVCIDAPIDDIKKAHKRMALKWHPDKASAEDRATCELRFKAIQEAFEVIAEAKSRERYDFGREKPPPIEERPLPKALQKMGYKVRRGDGVTTCMCCGFVATSDYMKRGHISETQHPGFFDKNQMK